MESSKITTGLSNTLLTGLGVVSRPDRLTEMKTPPSLAIFHR